MALTAGWDRETLIRTYHELLQRSARFRELAAMLTPEQWADVHGALDAGQSPLAVAANLNLAPRAVLAVSHPRACMLTWNHDHEKLADCIDGKIEP
jgi:hypothetical protein